MRRILPVLAATILWALPVVADDPPVQYLDHLRGARMWLEAKQAGRAESELVRALLLYSKDPDGWLELARAFGLREDGDGVLLASLGALAAAPGNADAHALLGDVFAQLAKPVAAVWYYAEAERLAAAGQPLDPEARRRGVSFLAAAAKADAGAVDLAREAAAHRGAPVRLVARYLGRAENDGARRGASAEAGQALAPALLRTVVLDDVGFPVTAELSWSAGEGVALDTATVPPTVRGPAKPGEGAIKVRVKDGKEEQFVEIPLVFVGPLTALAVQPEDSQVKAGQKIHVRLAPTDEAGHRLWFREFAWAVEPADTPAGRLVRATSIVTSENNGEAHRNIFEVRLDHPAPPGTSFKVIGKSLDGAVTASATYTVVEGTAAGKGQVGGIPWLYSYEEALQQARVQKRPLFVEVMADW